MGEPIPSSQRRTGPQPVPQQMPSQEDLSTRTELGLLVVGKVLAYVLYAYVVFIDIMLLFRILLLAFGANPTVGFSQFVFQTTSDALAPFRGLFPPRAISETGYLDVSALFAIVVYLLIAYGVGHLVEYLNWKVRSTRKRA